MNLIHDKNGRTLLHIWRTGTSFELTNRYPLYQDWNNVKFSTLPYADDPPFIRYLELRKPMPFKDNQFDIIYCNHVLEHLIPEDGIKLCRELYRILKPRGICRLVVPDLESAAIEYINTLEKVQKNQSQINIVQYEWSTAHLIDQMVRNKPGGQMAQKLHANQVDWEQITRDNGDVFDKIREKNKNKSLAQKKKSLRKRIVNIYREFGLLSTINKLWYHYIRKIYILFSKKSLVELYNERSLWMYDRQSLSKLLVNSNFKKVNLMSFKTSKIMNWGNYNFDQSEKGDYALEPSVYMEGEKTK